MSLTIIVRAEGQEAEEFLKRLNGVTYIHPYSDECMRGKLTVDINGEYLTYGDILDWATSSCMAPNRKTFGMAEVFEW
jgi:hypothetical protein